MIGHRYLKQPLKIKILMGFVSPKHPVGKAPKKSMRIETFHRLDISLPDKNRVFWATLLAGANDQAQSKSIKNVNNCDLLYANEL